MPGATPGGFPYPVDTDLIDVAADIRRLAEAIELANPVGIISIWGSNTPPPGWLMCDNTAVSRTQYPVLFQRYQTVWGAGDGVNTFNLPDFRQYFLVGRNAGDPLFDVLAGTGGARDALVGQHAHGMSGHVHHVQHIHPGTGHNGNSGFVVRSGGPGLDYPGAWGGMVHDLVTGGEWATPPTGNANRDWSDGPNIPWTENAGDAAGNNGRIPPYRVVNYIIRAG